jgi:hypothetical protein
MTAETPRPDPIEERYFLSYGDTGQWRWTGQIRQNLGGGHYLVDINSAVTGAYNESQIVTVARMEAERWRLFFALEDLEHQAQIEAAKLDRGRR